MTILESVILDDNFDIEDYMMEGSRISQPGQSVTTIINIKASKEKGKRKQVVLKVFPTNQSNKMAVDILKQCCHSHLVKLLCYRKVAIPNHHTYIYLYMEALDLNLKTFLVENDPPEEVKQEMVRQLLVGLQYLHNIGIVHRNIKPENVLVNKGEKIVVKLTDFGLIHLMPANISNVYMYSEHMTRQYASPEMVRALDEGNIAGPNFSTDIFSLGVVIFEMLSNKLPFTVEELRQKNNNTQKVINGQVTNASISQGLNQMFQWDPKLRPNAAQLLPYFDHKADIENSIVRGFMNVGSTIFTAVASFFQLVTGMQNENISTEAQHNLHIVPDRAAEYAKHFNEDASTEYVPSLKLLDLKVDSKDNRSSFGVGGKQQQQQQQNKKKELVLLFYDSEMPLCDEDLDCLNNTFRHGGRSNSKLIMINDLADIKMQFDMQIKQVGAMTQNIILIFMVKLCGDDKLLIPDSTGQSEQMDMLFDFAAKYPQGQKLIMIQAINDTNGGGLTDSQREQIENLCPDNSMVVVSIDSNLIKMFCKQIEVSPTECMSYWVKYAVHQLQYSKVEVVSKLREGNRLV